MGKVGLSLESMIGCSQFLVEGTKAIRNVSKNPMMCVITILTVTKGVNISELTAPDEVTQEEDPWDSILDVYRAQRNARPLDLIMSRLLMWVHTS
jgi:hypothetical protein